MKTHIENVGVHDIDAKGEDKLRGMSYPCHVEPKFDGELAWYIATDGNPRLVNKYGKARTDCPIIDQLPDNVILMGELYWAEGKNGAVYELLSNKECNDLKLMVFDIVQHGADVISNLDYVQRRQILEKLIPNATSHVSLAASSRCNNEAEVRQLFDSYKGQGYEGVMVKPNGLLRGFGADWIKLKAQATCDLKVIFIDPFLERMEVEVPFNGSTRKMGCKLPHRYKAKVKVGDVVEIKHYGVLSGGGLRHPSFVRVREEGKRVSLA